jgi:tetratricopeptide (TPR) repeat protein
MSEMSASPPLPVQGVDLRRLPIGPEEAFVLSRVDGRASVQELSFSTGLTAERVEHCLLTLARYGAVLYGLAAEDDPDSDRRPEEAASSQPTAAKAIGTVEQPLRSPSPSPPPRTPPPLYDPSELEEPGELEPERKRQILDFYYRLPTLNHYELLELERTADRSAVKEAYYRTVAIYHPDRCFGKNLGRFRERMEKCFSRLTEAHETLSSPERRRDYDAYLSTQRQAALLRRALSEDVTEEELKTIERELVQHSPSIPITVGETSKPNTGILDASAKDNGGRPTPPSAACIGTSPLSESVPPQSQAIPKQPSSAPPRLVSDEERRRTLARKLSGGTASLRPPPVSSTPPASIPKDYVADHLRQHYDRHVRESMRQKAAASVGLAEDALNRSDPMAASSSLEQARALGPQDPELRSRISALQARAEVALGDTLCRQANYEEQSGRFMEAARTFERAAYATPTPELWVSAARCQLQSGADLRQAGDFARRAVALAPDRPAGHAILGRVFLAAGMRSSAITELERARSLAPDDVTIITLLQRVQRGQD